MPTEVKLPAPVQATVDERLLKAEWPEGTAFAPGAYAVGGDPLRLWYVCPCGCGVKGGLRVYPKGTPEPTPKLEPTWAWDADETTLVPSVHHIGHWHGYLQKGMWVNA